MKLKDEFISEDHVNGERIDHKLDWTHVLRDFCSKVILLKKQRESKITTFRFFDLDRNCHE